MKDGQNRAIILIILLLSMEIARSSTVRGFFTNGWANLGTSISKAAQGKPVAKGTAADTLSWHQALWWSGAALLTIALADPFPDMVTAFLLLVMLEEALRHWSSYQGLITPPTK